MIKIISKLFLLIFDLFIFIIIFPVFLFLYIIISSYKAVILFVGNKLLGRKLIPFDGLKSYEFQLIRTDLNKITSTSNNNSKNNSLANVIGLLFTFEGELFTLETLRNLFYAKLLDKNNINYTTKYLNFQVKVVKFGGYVFREKVESVDLKKQIYSIDLPDSMTLEEFLADWFSGPFLNSSNGLLWEVALINCKNKRTTGGPQESYVATKMHHCLADGYTCGHMIDTFCGKETKYTVENFKCSVLANIYLTITAPRALFNLIRKLLSLGKHRIKIESNNYETRISYGTLNLQRVKEIKKRNNVKFQCVLQSLMVRAARELYLCNQLQIPQSAVFMGSFPWPGHPFRERMTNWASGYLIDGNINEPNPNKRVQEIEKQFNWYLSKGFVKMIVRVMGPLVGLVPNCLFNWFPNVPVTSGFTDLLADDEYELLGSKITHMHVMGGIQGDTALFGTSISHDDYLDYTIIANRQLVSQKDLDIITKKLIPEELDKMYTDEVLDKNIV